MKGLLLAGIILLASSISSKAHAADTLIFESCNRMYDAEQFREAYECYSKHDTNIYAIYMAAKTSLLLEDTKNFDKYAQKLTSRKYKTGESFSLCAKLYETQAEKLKIVTKGLRKFKNDTTLLIDLTNIYLESNNYELAMESVDRLISNSKGSPETYYFTKGFLFDMLGDPELALANYDKAIELDSAYFDPLYNAGVIHYNHAVEVFQKTEMNVDMDLTEYNRIKEEADVFLWSALPYFEKAHAIEPEDTMLTEILSILEYRLQPEMNGQSEEDSNQVENWE